MRSSPGLLVVGAVLSLAITGVAADQTASGQEQPAPPPPAAAPQPRPLPPANPDASAEPGPGREWTLTASTLTLRGARYHGIVEQDVAGRPVKTLHFTLDALEVTDLVQRGELPNGKDVRVAGAPGSTSTVTEGPIEIFTRELTGTLSVAGFPLARITLSAETLALADVDLSFLRLPDLTFRDAIVRNVYMAGGTLRIPGASVVLED